LFVNTPKFIWKFRMDTCAAFSFNKNLFVEKLNVFYTYTF
jgi:hypothetical protein